MQYVDSDPVIFLVGTKIDIHGEEQSLKEEAEVGCRWLCWVNI